MSRICSYYQNNEICHLSYLYLPLAHVSPSDRSAKSAKDLLSQYMNRHITLHAPIVRIFPDHHSNTFDSSFVSGADDALDEPPVASYMGPFCLVEWSSWLIWNTWVWMGANGIWYYRKIQLRITDSSKILSERFGHWWTRVPRRFRQSRRWFSRKSKRSIWTACWSRSIITPWRWNKCTKWTRRWYTRKRYRLFLFTTITLSVVANVLPVAQKGKNGHIFSQSRKAVWKRNYYKSNPREKKNKRLAIENFVGKAFTRTCPYGGRTFSRFNRCVFIAFFFQL